MQFFCTIFTASTPRPIQSTSYNVCLSVCISVCMSPSPLFSSKVLFCCVEDLQGLMLKSREVNVVFVLLIKVKGLGGQGCIDTTPSSRVAYLLRLRSQEVEVVLVLLVKVEVGGGQGLYWCYYLHTSKAVLGVMPVKYVNMTKIINFLNYILNEYLTSTLSLVYEAMKCDSRKGDLKDLDIIMTETDIRNHNKKTWKLLISIK